MEASCLCVEKLRDVMGTRIAMRSYAHIDTLRAQCPVDLTKLLQCIIGMQMLHQLIAIAHASASWGNVNRDTVRNDQLKVRGKFSVAVD